MRHFNEGIMSIHVSVLMMLFISRYFLTPTPQSGPHRAFQSFMCFFYFLSERKFRLPGIDIDCVSSEVGMHACTNQAAFELFDDNS